MNLSLQACSVRLPASRSLPGGSPSAGHTTCRRNNSLPPKSQASGGSLRGAKVDAMGERRATTDAHASDGGGHAPEVPAGYTRTVVGRGQRLVPEDWDVSTVGAEFRIQLGKMLDAGKNTGVSKPYIGNRSVQWGRIDAADIDTVPMTSADLQRFRLRSGDLLVCEGGEIGRAAIWDDPIRECYYQKALHRLRPTRGYDVYLMMSLLQLWASTGYLKNYVTQTSIAHLPKEKLEIVPLPVPTVRRTARHGRRPLRR